MRTLLFILISFLIISCKNSFNETVEPNHKIGLRTLPTYIIPYQYPSGDIETQTSADLQTWAAGYTASTTAAKLGTSSTLYNYAVPDNQRRCITIFQNSSDALKWVEYEDGDLAWSAPASISSASSYLLPSVEMNDGVVYEVHQATSSNEVKKSYKNGSSWSTPATVYYSTGGGFQPIPTDYSPTLEYHPSAGVEYLVAGYADRNGTGTGLPMIYWRYTNTYYTKTSSPSTAIGLASNELISSCTPIAVENSSNDELFLFYTAPGNNSNSVLEIRFIIGSVTGGNDGTVNWAGASSTISNAYTDHKIDGFYDHNTEEIVIAYRNYYTGEIDLAISGDFGANWTLETDIDAISGAPSIVNLE